MGTDVAQGEELPADIEYPYRAAFQRDDAATAGRDVCGWRYRVLQLSGSLYSALALPE